MIYRTSAFLRISFLVCTFLFSPTVFADNVSSFVFITEPQTIGIAEMSKEITVQAQNPDGISESVSETFDISFSSNSSTGEFLNSSGNPVSTTMSKNTANRTFYYRDNTSGDFVLSVTATGRTSQRSFSTSQHIFVGVSGGTTSTTTEETNSDETESGSNTNSSGSSGSSAHSSAVPLSSSENKVEFEISAGRDRLTTIGNTLVFQANPTKYQNVSEQSISYRWSFGDGTTAQGKMVNHAYQFAGEYAVVLNAVVSDKQAVSRLTVKVISPEITLARVPGGIEVTNKSGAEINLEGWSLIADLSSGSRQFFIFPTDTLIPSGKKVVFADSVTSVSSGDVHIENPLKRIFANIKEIKDVVSGREMGLEEIQAKVDEVKRQLAQGSLQPTVVFASTLISPAPASQEKSVAATSTSESQVANVVTVFEASEQKGMINTIFSWPVRGFNFIKRLFVEE
jgi:hypothetical protein